MSDEKLRILKLLEEKRITSGEAMALLEALDKAPEGAAKSGRFLRLRVYEGGGTEPKVNINVPLGWAKFMAPFIEGKIKAKLAEKGVAMDMEKLREAIEGQEPMKIVDVQDGGDKVEIFID